MVTQDWRGRLAHPVVLVLIGIVSAQVGAAIAKSIFDEVTPTAILWLRLGFLSVILLLIARPRVRGFGRRDWLVVLGFGASLGVMNWATYQSFARLPLGIAVTIGFIGPLSIALLASRRPVTWCGSGSRPPASSCSVWSRARSPSPGRSSPCSRAQPGRPTSCCRRPPEPVGRAWMGWRSPPPSRSSA